MKKMESTFKFRVASELIEEFKRCVALREGNKTPSHVIRLMMENYVKESNNG